MKLSLRTSLLSTLALALLAAPACDSSGGTSSSTLPEVGGKYPSAMINDCAGDAFDINTWIGEHDVVYIGFGAQWCQACQEEAPVLNEELVDGLDGDAVGVAQLLIEGQPGEAPPQSLCAAWENDLSTAYSVFVDPEQNSLEAHFGGAIANLPVHYIVTRDGTIRYRKVGALPDNIKQLVSDWIP